MKSEKIDELVNQLVFGNQSEKDQAYIELWNQGQEAGIQPASINDFYLARGRGELPLDFTVPAMNLRGIAYDMARAAFKVAVAKEVGALIFEIARSEIGYTDQSPQEYTGVIVGAALREGFQGPLFIQGDHYQLKVSNKAGVAKEGELEKVKALIKESIKAGFYNIDIDASTLVDYEPQAEIDQQKTNFTVSAQLTDYVRNLEPKGVTVSLGGEIGHIGGKNSTKKELKAYMAGFNQLFGKDRVGLSKISIQTGTHHGGVVLPDGSLAKVSVDFGVLKELAQVSRDYGMGGTVQHGASTLPDEYFAQFPRSEAIEVHLATGFQNIVFDHPQFPQQLLAKMYQWLDQEKADERKPDQSDKQFHYKLRKKAWGGFKKETWALSEKVKVALRQTLAERFEFMFKQLNVFQTKELVAKQVKSVTVVKQVSDLAERAELGDDKGLAD